MPVRPTEHLLDCDEALSDSEMHEIDEVERKRLAPITSRQMLPPVSNGNADELKKGGGPRPALAPPPTEPEPTMQAALASFALLVERETERQPIPTPESSRKRTVLMKWMLDVIDSFGLRQTTSGGVLALIDRALEKLRSTHQLALIALACLLIASKFHEIHPVAVDELQKCAKVYTIDDILKMERCVLQALDWQLQSVNAHELCAIILSQVEPRDSKLMAHIVHKLLATAACEAPWWLAERRSTVALAAVLAALEISGAYMALFGQFIALAVDHDAVDACKQEFMRLYDRVPSPTDVLAAHQPDAQTPT